MRTNDFTELLSTKNDTKNTATTTTNGTTNTSMTETNATTTTDNNNKLQDLLPITDTKSAVSL